MSIGTLIIGAASILLLAFALYLLFMPQPYRPYGEGMLPRYDDWPPLDQSQLSWRTYTSRIDPGLVVVAAQVTKEAGHGMTSDGLMCVWEVGDYVVQHGGHTYHVPGEQFVRLYQ